MDSEPPQRWADVPDESKQQLLELANQPGVVDRNGRSWQPRQLMAEFGLTRRQATAAIAALASGVTLGSALEHAVGVAAGAASETDSDGDVGQKSDRVDVFADGVDANSVSTDELTIAEDGDIQNNSKQSNRYYLRTLTLSDGDKTQIAKTAQPKAMVNIIDTNTGGQSGIVHLDGSGNSVSILSQSGGEYSTTEGNDTKTNVYWDSGNSQYELNNERGSNVTYQLHIFQ